MDFGTQTHLQRPKLQRAVLPDWPRLVQRATSGIKVNVHSSHRVPSVKDWSERRKSGFGVWETEGSEREIAPEFLYTSMDLGKRRKGTLRKTGLIGSPRRNDTKLKSDWQSPIHIDLSNTRRRTGLWDRSQTSKRPTIETKDVPDLSKRIAFQTLREHLRLRVLHAIYLPNPC